MSDKVKLILSLLVSGFTILTCFHLLNSINSKATKKIEDGIAWYKKRAEMLPENSMVMSENNILPFLIDMEEDYIYIVNKQECSMEQIKKVDILKIDTEVYTVEKNVKKLIALTETYSRNSFISSLALKIYTKYDTYNIWYILDGKIISPAYHSFNTSKIIDTINRHKLILEKDLENLVKN